MPRALLLSPDDQAVSAITAVLEAMSVTCERPLDGSSAAEKLNSRSFDLVLVDCENLPAAKLIFDVCRRGKGGNNPVPIAIVDGRAGLPTAFRLGAELILTKPVAKDQARNTIRTAVSRVKREEPAAAIPAVDQIHPVEVNPLEINAVAVNAVDANASESGAAQLLAGHDIPEPRAMAAAAASGACELTSYADAPAETLTAPAIEETAAATAAEVMSAPAAAPEIDGAEAAPAVNESEPVPPQEASIDPELEAVVADLQAKSERPDLSVLPQSEKQGENKRSKGNWSQTKPSQSPQGQRTRSLLVAIFVLVLAAAGFDTAWMYEPGFQALAKTQIDYVMKLAGMAHQLNSGSPAPVKPSAPQAAARPAAKPSALTALPPAPTPAPAPAPAPTAAAVAPGTAATGAEPRNVAAPTAAPAKVEPVKIEVAPAPASPAAAKPANEASSDADLPGEKDAVILSSNGAGKRLLHSVQATYPSGTHPGETKDTMVLKVVVDETGQVAGARVIEGSPALANAAISAARQWRYQPYVHEGKAQSFQTIVLVDFQRP